MAIVNRLYVEKGPSNNQLQLYADPAAIALERFKSPVVRVQYDDALPDTTATIDAYMDQLNYDPSPGDDLSYAVLARLGNPGASVDRATIYAKLISGVVQLFVKNGAGDIIQLTPTQNAAGYVRGLVPSFTSVSTVTISLGTVRDRLNKMDLILTAPVVVNIAAAGVNGLDTGVEANNTWYFLFAIGDTNGVNPTACIISASQNSPAVFPAGYDVARRIGSVRNDAASNFRDFFCSGEGMSRSIQYRDALSARSIILGGAAIVVTDLNLAQFVPPTSQLARLQYQQRGATDGQLYIDSTFALANFQRSVMAGATACDVIQTMANRHIGYANAGGVAGLVDVWANGYEESI
jgi:hypothetical protein